MRKKVDIWILKIKGGLPTQWFYNTHKHNINQNNDNLQTANPNDK